MGSAGHWPAVFGGSPKTFAGLSTIQCMGQLSSPSRQRRHAGRVRSPFKLHDYGLALVSRHGDLSSITSRAVSPLKPMNRINDHKTMKPKLVFAGCLFALALVLTVSADTLQLKNGKTLTGKYAGGAASTINFQTPQGMQVIDTGQAASLTFTAPAPTVVTTTPAAAPAASGLVNVPAGTLLLVRLDSAISSDSAAAGQRFSCRLET